MKKSSARAKSKGAKSKRSSAPEEPAPLARGRAEDSAARGRAGDSAARGRAEGSSARGRAQGSDRAARKDAKRFLADIRKLAKKHAKRLSPPEAEQLRSATQELEAALARGDPKLIREKLDRLDEEADRVLGFARKSVTREYAESIIIAVAIALFLRAFVIEAFKIPTGSMVPTLLVGDHIFVNKFIYGLRVPFTNAWFVQWSDPDRGDVIVFRYPPDPDKDYIKRVVAVAGDEVAMRGQSVWVNGQRLERDPLRQGRLPRDGRFVDFEETSRRGEQTYVVRYVRSGRLDKEVPRASFSPNDARAIPPREVGLDCGPEPSNARTCTVKEGYVFVMGDNRNKSSDSRVWGAVPIDNVKGKAMFVWSSWGSSWLDFRFDRIGRAIH